MTPTGNLVFRKYMPTLIIVKNNIIIVIELHNNLLTRDWLTIFHEFNYQLSFTKTPVLFYVNILPGTAITTKLSPQLSRL